MKSKNLILSLIILFMALLFASCSDEQSEILSTSSSSTESTNNGELPDVSENGQNPDDLDLQQGDGFHRGYVFTESNDASMNSILVYEQTHDGSLSLLATVSSGGEGTGGGLGNQGAIALNDDYLYAVNAGGNSVSSFQVHNSCNLVLKNTIETQGKVPNSLTVHDRLMYVLNMGSDNISGFRLQPNGHMTHIPGSVKSLSQSGAGGAQISFSPNGKYLYVTEKATNMITYFEVRNNGSVGPGTSIPSTGQTPFGFNFARDRYMIVSNAAGGAPNASSATSYGRVNNGNPTPILGAVPNNQSAACWVATTKYGRFAFVTNTASANVSSYYVAPFGAIFVIHEAFATENGPTEVIVSGNNRYVYVLNSASHTISSFRRTLLGGLDPIGTTSGVPDAATGFAAN